MRLSGTGNACVVILELICQTLNPSALPFCHNCLLFAFEVIAFLEELLWFYLGDGSLQEARGREEAADLPSPRNLAAFDV